MIVVDSSAVFAILNDEVEAHALARCIVLADSVRMSMPTWVELALVVNGRFGAGGLQRLDAFLKEADVGKVDFDTRQAGMAIEANRRFGKGSGSPARLNLGDCFSYALAKALDWPLLYVGNDFIHTDVSSAMDQ